MRRYLDRIDKEFNAVRDLIVTDQATWLEALAIATDEWKQTHLENLEKRVIFFPVLNQLVFIKCRY